MFLPAILSRPTDASLPAIFAADDDRATTMTMTDARPAGGRPPPAAINNEQW